MIRYYLNKCVFYTLSGSNIVDDLKNLYGTSIDERKIDYNFDIHSIDSNKINFLVINWWRNLPDFYNSNLNENQFAPGYNFSNNLFVFLKKLIDKDFYFIIDNVMEAETFITPELIYFFEKIKKIGISENKLLWVDNNSVAFNGEPTKIKNFKINRLHFPHFFVSTIFNLSDSNNKKFKIEKDFLILNRRLNLGKFRLLKILANDNLLENSIYSILSFAPGLDEFYNENPKLFELVQIPNDVAKLEDIIKDDEFLYRLNTDVFFKTKINIVSETFMDFEYTDYKNKKERYNDIIHITEKTWKPIYLGVPFVIAASNNHLKTIKEFGFKTFDSIIDESYDTETNTMVRLKKVVESAKTLSKKYKTKEVLEITKFNRNLFKDLNHKREIVEKYFLNNLKSLTNKEFKLI